MSGSFINVTPAQEIDALWSAAEARREAGQPPANVTAPAYSMPPGDGEISARAWLTPDEADRVHALGLQLQAARKIHDAGAHERLLAKHAARRAKKVQHDVVLAHEVTA